MDPVNQTNSADCPVVLRRRDLAAPRTRFQQWCGRGHREGITELELCRDAWNSAIEAAVLAGRGGWPLSVISAILDLKEPP